MHQNLILFDGQIIFETMKSWHDGQCEVWTPRWVSVGTSLGTTYFLGGFQITVELVAILLLSEARLGLVFRKKILLIFMSSGNRKNYKRFLEKHRFGTTIFRVHSGWFYWPQREKAASWCYTCFLHRGFPLHAHVFLAFNMLVYIST